MAISKAFIASLLISLLVLQLVEADVEISNEKNDSGSKIDCGSACIARCNLSSRPNLCHRACGSCCAKCNCVPPGTYGNYDKCACYANQTTHGGRRKCP
ncbi:unnamed protein product [Eruca vesicaria subsp. sativa]|uniref:Uncharacterized protein n=1 Tax=Eruca vesicaria subsp. sativa TaxID=29727 RepID=A0ABC8INJ8_ERUVS|nr:unnamed protein product [Eruca vesicaria subsp. sativa]